MRVPSAYGQEIAKQTQGLKRSLLRHFSAWLKPCPLKRRAFPKTEKAARVSAAILRSFGAEGVDGVDLGGAARRQIAGYPCNGDHDQRCQRIGPGIHGTDLEKN